MSTAEEHKPRAAVLDAVIAAPVLLFWSFCGLLPVGAASRLGGWLGVLLGCVHRKREHVVANLRRVHPDLDAATFARFVRDTWRNAGAVIAEMPHLPEILASRVTYDIDPETAARVERGERVMVVSAHLANWEVVPYFLAKFFGPIQLVFTPFENRFLTARLQRYRRTPGAVYIEKEGALAHMMRGSREGLAAGVMGDIRIDSGEMLDFFGSPAPTSIAAFRIAQRLRYPIAPVYAVREGPARFRVVAERLIDIPTAAGKEGAMAAALQVNGRLEQWLRLAPGQWWCMKRRWPRPEQAAVLASAPGT